MISLDLAAFLAFVAIVAAIVWRDRKNIKPVGLVLMRHTQRGKAWLYSVADRWPRMWRALATLGVAASLPAMAYVTYFLLHNSWNLLSGQAAGAVKIVLPWSGFGEQPGVFFVPWYFWVVGILLVVVPHELFHGIACRLGKIRIRSLGWMLLLFIPGAFVDPDKRQLEHATRFAKLRVYAAGSFANFAVGIACMLIGMLLLGTLFDTAGLVPSGVIQGTPAEAANLSGALLSVGGIAVNSQEDLVAALQRIPVGSTITVETTENNFTITTAKHPELNQSYLGIAGPYRPNYIPKPAVKAAGLGEFADFLVVMFSWLWLICFGIGMFNLLPIKPLDGGLIFEEIAGKFLRKSAARLATICVSAAMVALVALNIIGPALMR